MKLLVNTFVCILALGLSLYSYIDKENELTQIRMRLPEVAKAIKSIDEENMRLKYEIDQFENPQHLMELARDDKYSHLKYPLLKDILTVNEGLALQVEGEETEPVSQHKPKVNLATGATQ